MRRLQPCRRGRSELLVEPRANGLVGGERVRLASRRRERPDAQRGEALVERMRGGEGGQLGELLGELAPDRDGGQAVDLRGEAQLPEALGIGRGRPAPERERLRQEPLGAGGIARSQCRAAVAGEALEAHGVDLLRGDREPVAGCLLDHEPGVAERTAQARDQRLQRMLLVAWRVAVPERLDERAARHRATGIEREAREQRLQALAGHLAARTFELDDRGAEDRDAHAWRVPCAQPCGACPIRRPCCSSRRPARRSSRSPAQP